MRLVAAPLVLLLLVPGAAAAPVHQCALLACASADTQDPNAEAAGGFGGISVLGGALVAFRATWDPDRQDDVQWAALVAAAVPTGVDATGTWLCFTTTGPEVVWQGGAGAPTGYSGVYDWRRCISLVDPLVESHTRQGGTGVGIADDDGDGHGDRVFTEGL